ncbi:MAG TPA: hypothetical protein VNA24_25335 [Hyalangium sp.]|nr:hypothetical protein [Hyalangium sp.]
MRHLIESRELMGPLSEREEPSESGPAAASGVFLGESAPEEFLREVAATLTAFLKDEPATLGMDTGETPSAH